jgi:hypothetical protein
MQECCPKNVLAASKTKQEAVCTCLRIQSPEARLWVSEARLWVSEARLW